MNIQHNEKMISLEPYCDRKSFYNKCFVLENTDTHKYMLVSYETIVATYYKGSFKRTWVGYSVTTMRHVNAFRQFLRLPAINKSEWVNMNIESVCN